jgi:hypothetical protein
MKVSVTMDQERIASGERYAILPLSILNGVDLITKKASLLGVEEIVKKDEIEEFVVVEVMAVGIKNDRNATRN